MNDTNSITNKSTAFKTTLGQTSVSSFDAYNSRLKKRKIIVLGKMGVGKNFKKIIFFFTNQISHLIKFYF